jgi:hypothetical protein
MNFRKIFPICICIKFLLSKLSLDLRKRIQTEDLGNSQHLPYLARIWRACCCFMIKHRDRTGTEKESDLSDKATTQFWNLELYPTFQDYVYIYNTFCFCYLWITLSLGYKHLRIKAHALFKVVSWYRAGTQYICWIEYFTKSQDQAKPEVCKNSQNYYCGCCL